MSFDYSVLTAYPLAVGAALSGDASAIADLKAIGVTAVIDCQSEFDDGQLLAAGGFAYLWDPRDDKGVGGPVMDPWWRKGLDFARTHLFPVTLARVTTPPLLYIHCAAGINRGPSMAYGVLRAIYQRTPAEAEAAIRAVRPQVGIAYKADFERFWAQTHLSG